MDANGADVDALAAFVRTRFAAQLTRVQATVTATAIESCGHGAGGISARDALVPALRKVPPSSCSSSAAHASAWKRVLLMVFRRFANHLVVCGKLLNQEELLVSHFCRMDAHGRPHPIDCVRIPESLALRFVLPCEDGPAERVGHDDVTARVIRTSGYPGSGSGDVAAVVEVPCATSKGQYDEEQFKNTVSPSLWDEPRLLTDQDTLYGFNISSLLQANSLLVARMAGENEDAANSIISGTLAFSDLRCTNVMMQSYDIQTTTGFQSFITGHSSTSDPAMAPVCTSEAHPRSYISLGKAQKKRWADERLASGKELVLKGRLKDAIAEFSSCLKLEEAHVEALFARGDACVGLQQFSDAVRDFEAARRLERAFPGLDAALSRAKGKLKHSRHVEIPGSLLVDNRELQAPQRRERDASSSNKSRSRSNADTRAQASTTSLRSRSLSRSSLYKPGPVVAAAAADSKKLERDRLRRLLEEEVGASEKKRSRRHSTHVRSSSDDDSDDSRNRRKHSSKKKKKKDKKHQKSSKSSRKKKRSRRHSSDDDSSSDSDTSGSTLTRKSRRKKIKREREDSRQEGEPEATLHPILQRQRHRIWN